MSLMGDWSSIEACLAEDSFGGAARGAGEGGGLAASAAGLRAYVEVGVAVRFEETHRAELMCLGGAKRGPSDLRIRDTCADKASLVVERAALGNRFAMVGA